ncbi:magnesium transporter [Poseidonocella sp. HB161398]|uniref:magnesium transporter n=1 Tax=Poseidonocella sp. HB161398 TaxID=2320855 RepID=UPI001108CDE9|nr:magnesium transporter [Poseidonocella sp. HB161398]
MTETAAAVLAWDSGSGEAAERHNAEALRALDRMIKAGARREVLAALAAWPAADMLAAMIRLRSKRAQRLLLWLPEETSLAILAELDPRLQAVLVAPETRARFAKLIRKFRPEAALRLLRELPPGMAAGLLAERPDAEALRADLAYHWDSAAAHLQFGSLSVPQGWTIGALVEDIRRRSGEIERIEGVHVVDAERRLVGYLRIRDLLLHAPGTVISEVMRRDPPQVSAATDQEEVLALAQKRHGRALAVVDAEGRLLGAISRRGLEEIAREEAEEDMFLMAGLSPESSGADRLPQIVRRRLPWLVAGLLGATLTATVIGSYEATLTEAAILASFIPVVCATAGNASMQASTVSIQSLSGGASWRGDLPARLGREIGAAAFNGAAMGLAIAGLILCVSLLGGIDRPGMLAATVGLAEFLVIVMAGTMGTVVPLALHALKMDPAVATGIFILTANDVFGVLVLFLIATQLYL